MVHRESLLTGFASWTATKQRLPRQFFQVSGYERYVMSLTCKVVTKHCADCNELLAKGEGYEVGVTTKRRICGFCWANPGWPHLDPTYRERRLNEAEPSRGAFIGRLSGRSDPRPHG